MLTPKEKAERLLDKILPKKGSPAPQRAVIVADPPFAPRITRGIWKGKK